MQVNNFYENEIIDVYKEELDYLKKIQLKYKLAPPISITEDGKQMELKAGYVGIIKTPSREIIILPRYKEFDFSIILKFWLVVKTNKDIIDDAHIKNYRLSKDNFYLNVINQFIEEVRILCNCGLIADYQDVEEKSNYLRGKIVLDKFLFQPVKNKFICLFDDFNLNNLRNGVIKYCIKSMLFSTKDKTLNKKLLQLLPYFHDVKEKHSYSSIDFEYIKRSSNKLNYHYESVISLCELIINHMTLDGLGGKFKWFSFLVNYDKLFENFVRTTLQMKIGNDFRKLPKNHKAYARYFYGYRNIELTKSYDPDIVYRYDDNKNSCEIVLDVKNKLSNSIKSKNPNWFDNPDVFQIISYSLMQDTKKCVLIYPSVSRIKPIKLDITNQRIRDVSIYSVFVDLSHTKIGDIMDLLVEDVTSII